MAAAVFSLLMALVVVGWPLLLEFDRWAVDVLVAAVSASQAAAEVLRGITYVGGGEVSFLLLSLAVLWLLIRGAAGSAVYVAVTGMGAAVLDRGIKVLVGRVRPLLETPLTESSGASFPSGHTLNATITFGVLFLVAWPAMRSGNRWLAGAVTVLIVGLVAFSRVALGVHHPSDVLAGAALGVVWLGLTNWGFDVWSRPVARPSHPELCPVSDGGSALPRGGRGLLRLATAAVFVWGGLVAAGELVSSADGPALRFDVSVLQWVETHRNDPASVILNTVEWFGGTQGVVLVLAVAATVSLAALGRWRQPLFLLLAVAGETAIFLATASVVERSRPSALVLQHPPPTTSFPSGHVAAATALYGAIALLVLSWRHDRLRHAAVAVAAAIPLLVGVARVYRGLHYPTDVMAGAAFALLWTWICRKVVRPGFEEDSVASGDPGRRHGR